MLISAAIVSSCFQLSVFSTGIAYPSTLSGVEIWHPNYLGLNLPSATRGVTVPQTDLLGRDIGNNHLIKRVLTTVDVDKRIKDLEGRTREVKKAHGAQTQFMKTQGTGDPVDQKFSSKLAKSFNRDLENREQIRAKQEEFEAQIASEIEELNNARIKKDAKRYKKAADEFHKAFEVYFAGMETFLKHRKEQARGAKAAGESSKVGASRTTGKGSMR